jgi:hypothetical protein
MKQSMIRAALFLLLFMPSGIPIIGNAAKTDIPTILHVPGEVSTLQQAIIQISNGGIIELAAGTYTAPAGGWIFNDLGKGFTIRAASGAIVMLSGGGTTDVLRMINSSPGNGRPIVFQDLIFANGYSATNGIAGGVTLQKAEATFINCVFQNNTGNQPSTGGGGTLVAIDSIAFFFDCTWTGNSDKNYGGGLAVNTHSKAFIHNSRFSNNRTNLPNHSPTAAGGGIHVGNSTLRVSNTRFENNQAGYVGAALYSIGTWSDTGTDIIVSNCTFVNNQSIRDASVSFPFPTEGGGIHAEDLVTAKIYNSRFITNSAMVGGAVTLYRANVEIYDSVFLGNRATGSGAANGFGGAISAVSNDTVADGAVNRRPANLRLENSFIQGRYGSTAIAGQAGGGLYVAGDGNRMYGQNGVSQNGSAAQNRAILVVNNVVFYDLDVQETSGAPGTGIGGGILVDLTDLTLKNSLILSSDALGSSNSAGGGIAIINQSSANITGTTIARNTVGKYGGGVFIQGASVNISNSNLIENALTSIGQGAWESYGAAIFSGPYIDQNLPATGSMDNNIISNNTGLPIFDDDRQPSPINDIRYNSNQIYSTTFGDQVYNNSLPYYCCITVPQLNSLVITRSEGLSTTKSQTPNTLLSSPLVVRTIQSVPQKILSTNANGDPFPPTLAYLGYAWNGGLATLDGQAVSGNAGVSSAGTGTHFLSVGGTNVTASISQAPTPAATFTASGDLPVILNWSVTAGTFLDVAIDHGVTIPSSPSGTVQVSPQVYTDYWLYVITKEGGVVAMTNSSTPILNVPSAIDLFAWLNQPVNQGDLPLQNDGGGTLQWTATSQTLSLLSVDTPSGQTVDSGIIGLNVITDGLSSGTYQGYIDVNGGSAGAKIVSVTVHVGQELKQVYLPLVIH